VKNLPPAEEWVPRTITIPIPPPPSLSLSLSLSRSHPLPLPPPPEGPLAVHREAVWALAASASLLGISSIATLVVYVLLFP
jgi:hypothetical protein